MNLTLTAGVIGLIGLAMTVVRINRGDVSRKTGEYWMLGFLLLIVAGVMFDTLVLDNSPFDRTQSIETGSKYAFNYFFPERTFGEETKAILIGIVGDVIIGVLLLGFIGDSPKVDAAIAGLPMAYHFARTYNVFLVETVGQSFELGSAFWATLIVSWIMILPSYFIVKWIDNRFGLS